MAENEEIKEQAKKESKRAIKKREKEEARMRRLNQQERTPVVQRVVLRDSYNKRKEYKEALRVQAAELYQIDAMYQELASQIQGSRVANNENLVGAKEGDVISIQHTDENGSKTFSPPMTVKSVTKNDKGEITGYVLTDMEGKVHNLENTKAEVLMLKTQEQTHEVYERGKAAIEKADLGPKKMQKQIDQYQSRIAEADKSVGAWKDDYMKAPVVQEQPTPEPQPVVIKEDEKVKVDIAGKEADFAIKAVPAYVQQFMKENGMLEPDAKFMSSRQLGEYIKNTEFKKEDAEKLSAYLQDKPARTQDYVAYQKRSQSRAR